MSDSKTVPLISIRAEVLSADPDTCKFTVSQAVHPGGPFFYDRAERAAGSPLPEALFGLPGVAHVLVAENVVSVGKRPDCAWSDLKAAIGAKIRAQLSSGAPVIVEDTRVARTWGRPDHEVRAAIQVLLDGEINQSIAGHGGKISIVDFQDGRLRIAMSGGCQGCASSTATLRQGVELKVRAIAPEVSEIVDTTDHTAGKNPYYHP